MDELALVATVPVSKKKALRGGKLKKGCRYKGKRVLCSPAVAARLNGKSMKKGKRKGKRRGMPNIVPKTPQAAQRMAVFQALLEARKFFKMAAQRGDCGQARHSGQKIIQALRFMGGLPGKRSKKNPSGDVSRRNARYAAEVARIAREGAQVCGARVVAGRVVPQHGSSAAYEAHMRAQNAGASGRISGLRRGR